MTWLSLGFEVKKPVYSHYTHKHRLLTCYLTVFPGNVLNDLVCVCGQHQEQWFVPSSCLYHWQFLGVNSLGLLIEVISLRYCCNGWINGGHVCLEMQKLSSGICLITLNSLPWYLQLCKQLINANCTICQNVMQITSKFPVSCKICFYTTQHNLAFLFFKVTKCPIWQCNMGSLWNLPQTVFQYIKGQTINCAHHWSA